MLLEARGLCKAFAGAPAVRDVSFDLARAETLGVVGESGSGKTTLARCVLRAIDPDSGTVDFNAKRGWVRMQNLKERELVPLRREMQMIFQDPSSSLNPRMTVRQILEEPLLIHGERRRGKRLDAVREMLSRVRLDVDALTRYPHAFSGGQRQRVAIARALMLRPSLVVCDEPVSALDMSSQARIINLVECLQRELGLAYLFVAHDLAVVEHISHRIAVMYLGRIVEHTDKRTLFTDPRHPYTEALLSAVPIPDPRLKRRKLVLEGDVPSPINPPSGCHFHTRCPYAEERCRIESPALREIKPGHQVACHLR